MSDEFAASPPWTPAPPERAPLPPRTPLKPEQLGGGANVALVRKSRAWSDAAFWLFLVTNAFIFLRPGDWIPGVDSIPLYGILIGLTLAVWLITVHMTRAAWCPITICAVALLPVVLLSDLSHRQFGLAVGAFKDFSRRLIYFLLIIELINSPKRLRVFLAWITPCIAGLTLLGLAQYQGLIDIPNLQQFGENTSDQFDAKGNPIILVRLCSVGIFNDPNDMCLILCLGLMLSLYWLHDGQVRGWRYRWLPLCGMYMYAIYCTHSRGGLMAMISSILVLVIARFGYRRTLPLTIVLLPVLLLIFSGRQTEISTEQETAQDRIRLWSDGLQYLREAPIFGIGMNQFVERSNLVAHNSFVHCFAELGFVGGTLFLGAFAYAAWALRRLGHLGGSIPDDPLMRFRPYLLAALAAYCVGYMTLSRPYVEPTYLMLGLVAVYLSFADHYRPGAMPQLSKRMVGVGVTLGVAFVVAMYLFVRLFAHWSS